MGGEFPQKGREGMGFTSAGGGAGGRAVGEESDALSSSDGKVSRILSSADSPVINLSSIRSYALHSFLSSSTFS